MGIANAWNTEKITTSLLGVTTPISIPGIKRLDCLGVVAGAYAEGVGACGNVLGTLDGRVLTGDRSIPEFQAGLTNPLAMLEILSDPSGTMGDLVTGLLTGAPLQDLLTSDFVRLTVGGDRDGAKIGSLQLPNLVALTSHYGLINPIKINWLGQTLTIFPTAKINGKTTPNYVALPQLTGSFDASQLTPSFSGLSFDNINLGLLDLFSGSNPLSGLLGGTSTTSATSGLTGVVSGLTNTLGLGGILPLANVDTNTVQNLGTNTVVAKALGMNTTAVAPLAASYGVDGADATKLAAADTTNARSTTSSITSKSRDAVKNWKSQTQQQTQTMTNTAKQAATQAFQTPKAATEAWKAQRQQNQEAWQQQKQSWQQDGTNSWDSTPKSNSGEGTSNGFTSRFGSKFFSGNKGTSNPPASDGAQSTTPGPAGSASPTTGGAGQ
ncbi:hypothetical protein [Gordonia crocea]|uniref:Uncharacterized protein n=1 Tax=Gordonia crocea TaxID=589162 RepID=A0A7I9UZY8_9ACTN|nr:hypothetical protein [Gordonia crocea]GED98685.1 hypothetical protein nbrc107697_27240 [Gordonia crocea]